MADTSKCFSLVRGRVMRVTRLDACGAKVLGPDSTVVSEGFISVGLSAQTDEGQSISVTNAAGKVCILDEACPIFTGYNLEVQFCGVNPDLIRLMTGQAMVTDSQTTPQGVGFRMNSATDICSTGFALEVWSNVPAGACAGTTPSYGYFLVPFIKGGVIGDFSIENDAINFTLSGAKSRDGSAWGTGPYNVIMGPGSTSEVQTVTITGAPTGGTYTLTFNGETTGPIQYNATAAAVKSALEALAGVSVGDITTGGGPHPTTAITVTFGGKYAGTNVPQMTATGSLTGGTTPTVTVTTTTPGSELVASPLKTAILPNDHLHVEVTTVTPPTAVCGAIALGVPATGATAGTPGTYTPANSYGPATATDFPASGITASPGTAWTTGQHMVARDGTKAYWNGTAWIVGTAP